MNGKKVKLLRKESKSIMSGSEGDCIAPDTMRSIYKQLKKQYKLK